MIEHDTELRVETTSPERAREFFELSSETPVRIVEEDKASYDGLAVYGVWVGPGDAPEEYNA